MNYQDIPDMNEIEFNLDDMDYWSIEAVEEDNPNVRWIEPEELEG